jgi:hypothetical protein
MIEKIEPTYKQSNNEYCRDGIISELARKVNELIEVVNNPMYVINMPPKSSLEVGSEPNGVDNNGNPIVYGLSGGKVAQNEALYKTCEATQDGTLKKILELEEKLARAEEALTRIKVLTNCSGLEPVYNIATNYFEKGSKDE